MSLALTPTAAAESPLGLLFDAGFEARMLDIAITAGLVILVLLTGVILSSLARRATRWLVRRSGLESLLERLDVAKLLNALGMHGGAATFFGNLVWWIGLLITFASALEVLGLSSVASGVAGLVEFFPRLLAAVAVLIGGLLLADILRNVVARVSRRRADVESPEIVSRLVYYLTVTIVCTLAAEQIGIETGLLNALIQIAMAGGVLALGLAFALGSRDIFRNILARFYMERVFRPGDRLVLDDLPGTVVSYSAVAILVRFHDGDRVIPCRLLLDRVCGIERVAPQPPPTQTPQTNPPQPETPAPQPETPPSSPFTLGPLPTSRDVSASLKLPDPARDPTADPE